MFWSNVDCTRVGKDLGSQKYVDAIRQLRRFLVLDFLRWLIIFLQPLSIIMERLPLLQLEPFLQLYLMLLQMQYLFLKYGYLAAAYTTLGSYMVYFIFSLYYCSSNYWTKHIFNKGITDNSCRCLCDWCYFTILSK